MSVGMEPVDVTRPARAERCIERITLLEKLAKADDQKCTVIHAPSGYGKSVLMEQYFDQKSARCESVAWLAVSPARADASSILRDIADACNNACALDAKNADEGAVHFQAPTPRSLGQHLSEHCGDLRIFIDDMHHLDTEAYKAVQELISCSPPTVRFVLADRKWSNLGLAKLRLKAQVFELGVRDLAFCTAEVEMLFSDLTQSNAYTLYKKTLGWPAALRLARIFLSETLEPNNSVQDFNGSLKLVADYLDEEFFSSVDDDVFNLLIDSIILSPADRDSVAAVLGFIDYDVAIANLKEMTGYPFGEIDESIRLIHEPLFYDYFRRLLKTRRTPKEISEIHEKALEYHLSTGSVTRALENAVEVHNREMIVNVLSADTGTIFVAMVKDDYWFRSTFKRIEAEGLTDPFQGNPIWPYYLLRSGRIADALSALYDCEFPRMNAAASAPSTENETLLAFIEVFCLLYTEDKSLDDLMEHIGFLLHVAPHPEPIVIGLANLALATVRFRLGDLDGARETLKHASSRFAKTGAHAYIIEIHALSCVIALQMFDLSEADRVCRAIETYTQMYVAGDSQTQSIFQLLHAAVAYERGDLTSARFGIAAARQGLLKNGCVLHEYSVSLFVIEARLVFASDGYTAALAVLSEGIAVHENSQCEQSLILLKAEKLRLSALAPRPNEAYKIGQALCAELQKNATISAIGSNWQTRITAALAITRFKIAHDIDIEPVIERLANLEEVFRQSNYRQILSKIAVQKALALFVAGHKAEAASLLRDITTKSDGRSTAKSFLLEEGELARLLLDDTAHRYQRSRKNAQFNDLLVKITLASFDYAPSDKFDSEIKLSSQQLRILRLLAEGLDRQEIAEGASTTIHNVQYHLKKMFTLFEVHSSSALVAHAIRRNLVDDRTA